jgi:hypothetical protein
VLLAGAAAAGRERRCAARLLLACTYSFYTRWLKHAWLYMVTSKQDTADMQAHGAAAWQCYNHTHRLGTVTWRLHVAEGLVPALLSKCVCMCDFPMCYKVSCVCCLLAAAAAAPWEGLELRCGVQQLV